MTFLLRDVHIAPAVIFCAELALNGRSEINSETVSAFAAAPERRKSFLMPKLLRLKTHLWRLTLEKVIRRVCGNCIKGLFAKESLYLFLPQNGFDPITSDLAGRRSTCELESDCFAVEKLLGWKALQDMDFCFAVN